MAETKKALQTKNKFYEATGRRKEATANVRLFEGKGESIINGKPVAEYFPSESQKIAYIRPFKVTETEGKFYFVAKAAGGGKDGQLGAVVLGISRALLGFNESLKKSLRDAGLMTRDPREKERKKYFLVKARKRPQYSKR